MTVNISEIQALDQKIEDLKATQENARVEFLAAAGKLAACWYRLFGKKRTLAMECTPDLKKVKYPLRLLSQNERELFTNAYLEELNGETSIAIQLSDLNYQRKQMLAKMSNQDAETSESEIETEPVEP